MELTASCHVLHRAAEPSRGRWCYCTIETDLCYSKRMENHEWPQKFAKLHPPFPQETPETDIDMFLTDSWCDRKYSCLYECVMFHLCGVSPQLVSFALTEHQVLRAHPHHKTQIQPLWDLKKHTSPCSVSCTDPRSALCDFHWFSFLNQHWLQWERD